ncbi:MAG: tRNA dihydrouridine synthase DusB [Lautropia sp.]
MLTIGRYAITDRAWVAPMAGVTDRPFRQLCKRLGASYAVSEMAASNPRLWHSVKTARRIDHEGEAEPKAVQIAGADPTTMAEAARFNVDRGAQIIDINMGCPAKKVCNVAAGSALMGDEALAIRIIEAVVGAVDVPVTLKMRTGPSVTERNAPRLARAAQQAGVAMVAVHARSRACRFHGTVDWNAVADVREAIDIPLVANGDIDSPARARAVLDATGADAVMIGRAAQGRPWIFREIDHYLGTGELLPAPRLQDIGRWLHEHLLDHYRFYGEHVGVRTARKHIGWYLDGLARAASGDAPSDAVADERSAQARAALRDAINRIDSPDAQLALVDAFFDNIEQATQACQVIEGAVP